MANTKSMQETFTQEKGYKFEIVDAQQETTKQIRAIRDFIQRGVDYIVLAPNTETGWDTVLSEAKDAGIPVVIVDRMGRFRLFAGRP
jgi:simple sugar transport system substrate-binding protein